jgi:hypothetical protein
MGEEDCVWEICPSIIIHPGAGETRTLHVYTCSPDTGISHPFIPPFHRLHTSHTSLSTVPISALPSLSCLPTSIVLCGCPFFYVSPSLSLPPAFPQPLPSSQGRIKGTLSRYYFASGFLHKSSSPKVLKYLQGHFNFFENS